MVSDFIATALTRRTSEHQALALVGMLGHKAAVRLELVTELVQAKALDPNLPLAAGLRQRRESLLRHRDPLVDVTPDHGLAVAAGLVAKQVEVH